MAKTITAAQALDALDELEGSARGDEPFNHSAAPLLRQFIEQSMGVQCEPQPAVTPDGFCEWVCPLPKGYLMQCCDCGLVHEAEFRVARYEPRPSENFKVSDDPDLQVQFRMRRAHGVTASDKWLPTAENINALPEPLRRYVADLETMCDPAGLVRENAQLKDANRGLQAMYRSAVDAGVAIPRAPGAAPEDSYPDQTVLHDERNVGNCLQATIAGVLGWPLAAVPHFALLGEDHWWDCAQAWLDSQGYWIDYQPTSYAAEGGELMPRCWLSGTSPRGFSHAVVGDSATLQMLHDPHPTRGGLVEHNYTIYFFRKPARGVPVVAAANPSLDQGPCTVCGKLWRDHGSYPVYESHNYTPASGVALGESQ